MSQHDDILAELLFSETIKMLDSIAELGRKSCQLEPQSALRVLRKLVNSDVIEEYWLESLIQREIDEAATRPARVERARRRIDLEDGDPDGSNVLRADADRFLTKPKKETKH